MQPKETLVRSRKPPASSRDALCQQPARFRFRGEGRVMSPPVSGDGSGGARAPPILQSDSPRLPDPRTATSHPRIGDHQEVSASAPAAQAPSPTFPIAQQEVSEHSSAPQAPQKLLPQSSPFQTIQSAEVAASRAIPSALQVPGHGVPEPGQVAATPNNATPGAVNLLTAGAGPSMLLPQPTAATPNFRGPAVSKEELKAGLKLTLNHASGSRQVKVKELEELKPGCQLFHTPNQKSSSNTSRTVFKTLPAVLTNGLVVYAKSEAEDHLVPSVDVVARGATGPSTYARLYVLWPSSMERVPRWLRHNYTQLDPLGSFVRVEWHAAIMAKVLLTISRKYQEFKSQQLLVYESKTIYPPNSTFATLGAGTVGEPTDRPYILAFKLASSDRALITPTTNHGSLVDPFAPSTPKERGGLDFSGGGGGAGGGGDDRSTNHGGAGGKNGVLLTPELLANIHAATSTLEDVAGRANSSSALQHLGRLLHDSNSTALSEPMLGSNGKLNFNDLPRIALQQRNLDNVKLLIMLNVLSQNLKARYMYEQFERLAVSRRDAELLLILQHKTKHELTVRGLAFLLNYMWSMARRLPPSGLYVQQASGTGSGADFLHRKESMMSLRASANGAVVGLTLADEIQAFLLQYLTTHRNPLSVTSAVLKGIQREMLENEECKHYMGIVAARFQTLNTALLKQLGRIIGHTHSVALLHSVLDPRPASTSLRPTVNDTSPISVALDSSDMQFLVHPLVIEFTRRTWHGASYTAQTSCADPRSTSLLSPLVGWRLLKDSGFAGGPANFVIEPSTRLWHMYTFTSQAFFNSPRGRWALHAMSETLFLIIFQLVVFYPTSWFTNRLLIVFTVQVAGNLLEICQHVQVKHGSALRVNKYLVDMWNSLNFFTNLILAVLLLLLITRAWRVPGTPFEEGYVQGSGIQLAICTMAAPVWLRSLSMVVPVYPRLGPLLITVARMLSELFAFLFPLFVVMAGFATMLVGAFHETITNYETFIAGLLTMFQSMLGSYSYEDFQTDDEGNPIPNGQSLYGSIVLSIYIILTTVLLLNLLIAIITNRYRPDDLEAEQQMKTTRIVNYYHLQIQNSLVCSPFNVVQVFFFWLPSPSRLKNRPAKVHMWGLLALDGPSAPGDVTGHLRAGWGEVPHLFFLLTLYPLMAVVANVGFYLYTPFAVWRFSTKTFKRLTKAKKEQAVVPDEPPMPAAPVAEGRQGSDGSFSAAPQDELADSISGSEALRRIREAMLQAPSTTTSTAVAAGEWTIPAAASRDTSGAGSGSWVAPSLVGSVIRPSPLGHANDRVVPPVDSSASRNSMAISHGARRSVRSSMGPVAESKDGPIVAEGGSHAGSTGLAGSGPSVHVSQAGNADARLYRQVSDALYASPALALAPSRSDGRLEKLEASLLSTAKKSGLSFTQAVLYWTFSWVLITAGTLVYVLGLGVVLLTGWTTIYLWCGKVIFSLNNVFVAPWWGSVRGWFIRQQHHTKAVHPEQEGQEEQEGGASAQAAGMTRGQVARKRWQAAAAKVVQARTQASADDVMRPRDLAIAFKASKFARLLPKWGCSQLLADADKASMDRENNNENEEPADNLDRRDDDEDSDDEQFQEVLDALAELKNTNTQLATEVAQLKKRIAQQHNQGEVHHPHFERAGTKPL